MQPLTQQAYLATGSIGRRNFWKWKTFHLYSNPDSTAVHLPLRRQRTSFFIHQKHLNQRRNQPTVAVHPYEALDSRPISLRGSDLSVCIVGSTPVGTPFRTWSGRIPSNYQADTELSPRSRIEAKQWKQIKPCHGAVIAYGSMTDLPKEPHGHPL